MRLTSAILLFLAASPAAAGEWAAVPEESDITFSGLSSGQPFEGRIPAFTGSVCFDETALDKTAGAFEFDLSSATTGIAQRDEIMKASEWLNAKAHPTASFDLTGLERLGPNAYQAAGALTIKGKTREVSFPLTLDLVKNEATGVVTIDRRDYNVGEGQWGETPRWVSFDLKIAFRVRAEPESEDCRETR